MNIYYYDSKDTYQRCNIFKQIHAGYEIRVIYKLCFKMYTQFLFTVYSAKQGSKLPLGGWAAAHN